MEAFNNVLTMNIVLLLLQCTCYMNADCVTRTYKTLPSLGLNSIIAQSPSTFKSRTQIDITECGQWCADEPFCKMWRFHDGKCKIFHAMNDRVKVKKSERLETSKTYYETDEDEKWTKIYFVKSGSGFDVLLSFLGRGTYSSWGPSSCTRKMCPDLFRSSLIDAWENLPIKQVKFSIRKRNKGNLSLIFDGRNSNKTNWFSISRVLESPWKDLHKAADVAYFLVFDHPKRSFYTALHFGECPVITGWIYVFGNNIYCPLYELHKTYPQIMYSEKSTATNWNTGYALADSITIYVSFE